MHLLHNAVKELPAGAELLHQIHLAWCAEDVVQPHDVLVLSIFFWQKMNASRSMLVENLDVTSTKISLLPRFFSHMPKLTCKVLSIEISSSRQRMSSECLKRSTCTTLTARFWPVGLCVHR